MPTPTLDEQLEVLEAQLNQLKAGLLEGNPAAVQAMGAAFQRLSIEFAQFAGSVGRTQLNSPQRIRKIKSLMAGMAALRENLMRQIAYVERALSIVLPKTPEKSTYGSGSTGAYGTPGRRSGTFSGFTA